MVTSLFSIFEPCSSLSSLTWLSPFLLLSGVLSYYYLSIPYLYTLFSTPYSLLKSELDTLLTFPSYNSLGYLFYWVWVVLLSLNSIGLFPYIFTSSSHISITSMLALLMWVTFLQYGWGGSPGKMLKALVPSGTPLVLMPFMVIIESISVAIRPITLSVRLTANMVAGHLLLSLCASGFESVLSISPTFVCQTILMVLEVAVAAIQAYVFTMLVSLYSKETYI